MKLIDVSIQEYFTCFVDGYENEMKLHPRFLRIKPAGGIKPLWYEATIEGFALVATLQSWNELEEAYLDQEQQVSTEKGTSVPIHFSTPKGSKGAKPN